MSYLADTSAVWRIFRRQVDERWSSFVARGLVAICPPVESELLVSARSEEDYQPFFSVLSQTFTWFPTMDDPWPKILAVQRDLIRIGHHRGPSPMDILIALTANHHQLTLIHVDNDFRSIAKVMPGLAMIRINE